MLANRLKKVLPHIISESQSAFQSNKAISDNILVAFETLHHMKRKKIWKNGFYGLKIRYEQSVRSLRMVIPPKDHGEDGLSFNLDRVDYGVCKICDLFNPGQWGA